MADVNQMSFHQLGFNKFHVFYRKEILRAKKTFRRQFRTFDDGHLFLKTRLERKVGDGRFPGIQIKSSSAIGRKSRCRWKNNPEAPACIPTIAMRRAQLSQEWQYAVLMPWHWSIQSVFTQYNKCWPQIISRGCIHLPVQQNILGQFNAPVHKQLPAG